MSPLTNLESRPIDDSAVSVDEEPHSGRSAIARERAAPYLPLGADAAGADMDFFTLIGSAVRRRVAAEP